MNNEMITKNRNVLAFCSLFPLTRVVACVLLLRMNGEMLSAGRYVYVAIGTLAMHAILLYRIILGRFDESMLFNEGDMGSLQGIQEYLILSVSLMISSSIYLFIIILLYIFVQEQSTANDYMIFIPVIVSSLIFIYGSSNVVSSQITLVGSDPSLAKQQMIQKVALWSGVSIIGLTISLLMIFGDIALL